VCAAGFDDEFGGVAGLFERLDEFLRLLERDQRVGVAVEYEERRQARFDVEDG